MFETRMCWEYEKYLRIRSEPVANQGQATGGGRRLWEESKCSWTWSWTMSQSCQSIFCHRLTSYKIWLSCFHNGVGIFGLKTKLSKIFNLYINPSLKILHWMSFYLLVHLWCILKTSGSKLSVIWKRLQFWSILFPQELDAWLLSTMNLLNSFGLDRLWKQHLPLKKLVHCFKFYYFSNV